MKRMLLALALVVTSGFCATAQAVDQGLSAYNPAISVILAGHAYYDNRDNEGPTILDRSSTFANEGDEDLDQQSFNLDGSELTFTSNVDPYFKAWLTATFEGGEVEVEEAWLQTLALPYGLRIKAGRFLSKIGYHNTHHKHQWDFIDQNLAYTALFHGEHLNGDGIQLTWLPATSNYWLFGIGVLQGEDLNGFGQSLDLDSQADRLGISKDALGLDEHNGPNLFTAFVHFAPNMGTHQALQLGLSAAWHRYQQNVFGLSPSGELVAAGETPSATLLAEGDATLLGLQLVYKRFATDSYGTHGLEVVAEMFTAHSKEDGEFFGASPALPNDAELRENVGYIKAAYGFAPRWQFGLRHAVAGFGSHVKVAGNTLDIHSSRQDSAELTWNLSEFSHLHLQFSHNHVWPLADESGPEEFNQLLLSYVILIGAHPAHHF